MVACRLGREAETLMGEPGTRLSTPPAAATPATPALPPNGPDSAASGLHALSKDELIRRLVEARGDLGRPSPLSSSKPKSSSESQRRESVLFMRLTAKEQEVQECLSQMEELRSSMGAGLRSSLLDPVVSTIFANIRAELHSLKANLEKSHQEALAWKFTPDSTTGKRLMAKCRSLIAENEELGKAMESGRLAELEGELGLLRKHRDDLQKGQSEVDDLLVDLDEDCEGLQATVIYLQKELETLKTENGRLRVALGLGPEDAVPSSPPRSRPSSTASASPSRHQEEGERTQSPEPKEEPRTPMNGEERTGGTPPPKKMPRLQDDPFSPSSPPHPSSPHSASSDLNGFHHLLATRRTPSLLSSSPSLPPLQGRTTATTATLAPKALLNMLTETPTKPTGAKRSQNRRPPARKKNDSGTSQDSLSSPPPKAVLTSPNTATHHHPKPRRTPNSKTTALHSASSPGSLLFLNSKHQPRSHFSPQTNHRASPTSNYAGAKFSESPVPAALPPPPVHWVIDAHTPPPHHSPIPAPLRVLFV